MTQPEAGRISCLTVWGGNSAVDSELTTTGLEGWLLSLPHAGAEAGGDIHLVSSCASGRITRLLVADFSGHGHAVARIAAKLRRLMQRYVNFVNQKRLIHAINRQFDRIAEPGSFATAIIATFFSPTRGLTLYNAGHPPPLVYRRRTGQWQFLTYQGATPTGLSDLPLGVVRDSAYEAVRMRLDVGDLLLCYTDSLTEAADATGRQLGQAGLLQLVEELGIIEPDVLAKRLAAAVAERSGERPSEDDLTILVLRANGAHSTLKNNLLAPVLMLRRLVGQLGRPDPQPPAVEVES